MTIEEIRNAARAEPFEPFTLRMADRHGYHVVHPEFLFAPPKGRRVVVITQPDDALRILDPRLVMAIEFGNGKDESDGQSRSNG